MATHSCDVGYELSGGTERTCQSDGTWSGGVITCIGMIHYLFKVYIDDIAGAVVCLICKHCL